MIIRDAHSAIVRWVAKITGVTTIKAYQAGAAPATPYIWVNLLSFDAVREQASDIEYTDLPESSVDPLGVVMARPVLDVEHRFSIHAFGPNSFDVLRPLVAATRLSQLQEPLLPAMVIYEVSQIRHLPEWVDAQWEDRSQIDIITHSVSADEFRIDVIEQQTFDIGRA